MGVVYRAIDDGGHPVAFKLLRTDSLPKDELRARVEREAASLRKINHPSVAAMLDLEIDDDEMFIVYELIEGPTLDTWVADNGPLSSQQLADTATDLYDALAAVHEAGVIHRDMKPNNIIMSDHGPVLIDFGLAHGLEDHRLTRTGLVMGTPGYLAPELVNGQAPSQSSDLWGWGAVLAFAATGRLPFGEGSFQSVIARAMAGKADVNGLDQRVAWALRGALAVDPHHRWTPQEVLDELHNAALSPTEEIFHDSHPDVEATEVLDSDQLAAFAAGPTGYTDKIGVGHGADTWDPRTAGSGGTRTEVIDTSTSNDGHTRAFTVPSPAPEPLEEPTQVIATEPAYQQAPPSFAPGSTPATPMSPEPPGPPLGGYPQVYGTNDAPVAPPQPPDLYTRPSPAPRPFVTIAVSLAFIAWGSVRPGWTLVVLILALLVARTVGVMWDSFQFRREVKGVTRRERAVLVAKSPLLVVRAALGLIPNVAVAVSCALVIAGGVWWAVDSQTVQFGDWDVPPAWVYSVILVGAGALILALTWWGPVSRLTRAGQREIFRGLIPQLFGTTVFVLIVIVIAGYALALLAQGADPHWAPLPTPPSFR